VRSFITFAVTGLIVISFLTFMMTYSVRFTESAVVTTFDKATANSVVDEAGLRFRWPYPIQSVTVYDTRTRLLTTRSETQQTADNRQIIVEAFLTWHVSDPLRFYQRFGGAGTEEREHYRAAENTLESLLRSAMAEVSSFTLSELFTTSGESRLPDLESRVMQRLQEAGEGGVSISDYGVAPTLVGINRIVLPEETTRQVFARMKATRERLAAEASSQGQALAATIKVEAEAAARRIEAFARRRAEEIRVQGDREAAQWYAQLNEDPELAVFLEKLDFLRNFYARRTTLLVPTTQPGMNIFDPAVLQGTGVVIPPFTSEPAADAGDDSGASEVEGS
jgi:membrane protease subunit HflC